MIETLHDEEAKVLKFLNTKKPHQMVHLFQGELLDDVVENIAATPFQKVEDIQALFLDLGYDEFTAGHFASEMIEWAYGELLDQAQERLNTKMSRYERKAANRARYLHEPVFKYYETETGKRRWQYEDELRSSGLMTLVTQYVHGNQDQPIALGILNECEEEGAWEEAMTKMVTAGVAISGGRLGWNMRSPGFATITRAFPKAIDFAAYNHGLNAPVLPEGYMPDAPVTFAVLRDIEGRDLATDGSGIYHPNSPCMATLIAKYGLVAFQFRAIHPTKGLFAKGIMFPSELALNEKNEPGIVLDWGQVKGLSKTRAKERRANDDKLTVDGMHIGILNAWHRPGKLSACFELLENIQVNERTIELTKQLVSRSMNLLAKRGIEGLVADVAKKDPVIHSMCQLITVARPVMPDMCASQIPRVREAIEDKLSRRLYVNGQGAGLRLPSYVARMDSTVPRGKCVISGMKPGKTVVGFRFPLILAQGLLSLTTMKPRPHHLVNNEMTPYTVILNPADCAAAQGDDDGDTFGFTDDPVLVELFQHRLDENKYHIEPKGRELEGPDGQPLKTTSPEGLKYLQRDHRDNVGRLTIMRSRLLAVRDYDGARALSIAIQECIDQAKRLPDWSNYFMAANLGNWEKDANGEYRFTIRFTPDELEDGGFPMEAVKHWVNSRLIQKGCCVEITRNGKKSLKARNPLWWREGGKKIRISEWYVPPADERNMMFENLPHIATRHAYELWREIEDTFNTPSEDISMASLLPIVLAAKGHLVIPRPLDEQESRRLRNICGLSTYSSKLKGVLGKKKKSEDAGVPQSEEDFKHRNRALQTAQVKLQETIVRTMNTGELSLDDVVALWASECSRVDEDGKPKINDAFRLVCFDGSPVMNLLGIQENNHCGFLVKPVMAGGAPKIVNNRVITRLEYVVDKALAGSDPFVGLRQQIENGRLHQVECVDRNGEPQALHQCPECMEALQTHLVRVLRAKKGGAARLWLEQLHTALK